MLWIDTFAPQSLEELELHPDVTTTLQRFATTNSFPHLIFYGPPGSGKSLRAHLLLKAIFGDGIDKLKREVVPLENNATSSNSTIEFQTVGSNYHAEIFASDLGTQDKQCVQVMIKQLASLGSATSFVQTAKPIPKYRVFVIHEAHCLSLTAQASLRRTLERFATSTRMILLTERPSSIIGPLKSRCFCIRVPKPTPTEVITILKRIAASQSPKQTINDKDDSFFGELATLSDQNLRSAIIMLQKAITLGHKTKTLALKPGWLKAVDAITHQIISDQSVQSLLKVREDLTHILVSCVDPQALLEVLARQLLIQLHQTSNSSSPKRAFLGAQAITAAAPFYSHAIGNSSKAIFQLEAFVATVMCSIATSN